MRLALERTFPPFWDWVQRVTLRQLAKTYEPYHPVFLGSDSVASGERACIDRWTLVQDKIKPLHPASFLDLGCAEGYFVLQAAKVFNCVSLGVDADIRRLTIAMSSAALNRTDGAGFIGASIDMELLTKLPVFEVVTFLSVMHHVMYEHGEDYARNLLAAIRKKTSKCLIFDMGQSNETSHEWASLLPPMKPSPEAWITQFLKSAGFSTVEVIGQSDAYRNAVNRILFIAYP
jgi:cyclopropane fatty-acyl-phospholipid synthase-like methyltransferase